MEIAADTVISSLIFFLLGLVYIFSAAEHFSYLGEKYSDKEWLARFFEFTGRRRKALLNLLSSAYKRRYVSLFLLGAVFVSFVSPVTSIMELEERVLGGFCESLLKTDGLSLSMSLSDCRDVAETGAISDSAMSFQDTRSHFIQIALWPAIAAGYGWLLAAIIWLLRKTPNEPVEAAIERLPHLQHALTILLIAVLAVTAYVQSVIGG